MAARASRIDALRGFAVIGILLVNIWTFLYGYEQHYFPGHGPLSDGDRLLTFLLAALVEQKFYPIFAFLFGAGFALQTGPRHVPGPALDAIKLRYRRRVAWLLACGVLHGTLVWFGDILTAYAVTAFWLVTMAGRPLSNVVKVTEFWFWLNLLIMLVLAWLTFIAPPVNQAALHAEVKQINNVYAAFGSGSWLDAARVRLDLYLTNIVGFLAFLPRVALLFMLGVLAVRCGWLTRPHRFRRQWKKVLLAGLVLGLPPNLWWGSVALARAIDPFQPVPFGQWALAVVDAAGPLLAAAMVAAFMLVRERLLGWLAPLGRMALTNYLAQSLVLVVLLQGWGLGWGARASRMELLALAAGLLALQWAWSRRWLARHAQGPAERLWRRLVERGMRQPGQ